MRKFKLYVEDEQGQRVLVDEFYPEELQQEVLANSSEEIKQRITEASDALLVLAKQPEFWKKVNRGNGSLKRATLMSDYDVLTEWLKYPEDEAKQMIARSKIQNLEELKLQVMAQNPSLMAGIRLPPEEKNGTDAETA